MSTATKITPPDDLQFNLFLDLPGGSKQQLKTALDSGRRFVTGDPRSIFLGATPLEQHLTQAGQLAPFKVAELLDMQDWSAFEERYAATGRAPYAPRLMLGLILYGVMQGIHSLREMERLARLDLGCMWVAGGITPDHANIGRFIVLHEVSLTQEFFESLTKFILKATGSQSTRLSGDGSVIEAACSHYKLLKAEAIGARIKAAQNAVANNPDDLTAKRELDASEECFRIFEERKKARQRSGRAIDTLCVSGTEPESMVQPLKRGKGRAASYKPSVLANENRIVTAIALDPSSENKVIEELLDQSARVVGSQAEELMLDAGYFDDGVIAATLERDISLLCPEGKTPGVAKQSNDFHKSRFQYEECTDTYRCPAGQTLMFIRSSAEDAKSRPFRLYGSAACDGCASRPQCTKKKRREIQRHPEDLQREALRQVMQQRRVRSIFCQRKAMVEPVFSHLRGQQGFNRFRRSGLQAVKREFALHVMAYNLSRAIALLRASFASLKLPLSAIYSDIRHFSCFVVAYFVICGNRPRTGH
jgi:transposase